MGATGDENSKVGNVHQSIADAIRMKKMTTEWPEIQIGVRSAACGERPA
jgi:hypothetical protein